jgi:ribonuclease BN (tRNA processing enzyme)
VTSHPLRVVIVGSGVLLPDDAHRSSGHWVSAEGGPAGEAPFRMLLDCGSGTLHGMARDALPWAELDHVVLSHFHTDHMGDLVPVLWALRWGIDGGRTRPLHLVGPEGLGMRLRGLADGFGSWLLEPGFPLHAHEVPAGGRWRNEDAGVDLVAHAARHTPEALAWRVEARGTRVGYTGDTGPLPALGAFFRGVELLVAECAVPDDQAMEIHLSPHELAPMAEAAAPTLLVTVHHYPQLDRAALPDLLRAAGYSGRVAVGHDGLALAVGPSAVRHLSGSPED